MELRAFFRIAGVFVSLGAACAHDEQPAIMTADVSADSSSGGPSTGDLPIPEPDPTTTAPTSSETTGSTDEIASTSTGTTGTGAFCGDGTVDDEEGEECDDGNNNSNFGACTHKCQKATCGDGYLWKGVEECDEGMANTSEYAGCRPDDCTWAARCGDGMIDPEHEECDLGDELNGTGDAIEGHAACSATCRWVGRLVFISSATYSGVLGGVSGADLKCQALAQAVGLTNPFKFRAWISDGVKSPASRFEEIDLTDAPYILRDGRIVAQSFDELTVMGPRTGISLTEKGDYLIKKYVWTNTDSLGAPFSPTDHCSEWTSGSMLSKARYGYNAIAVEQGEEWKGWLDDRLWTSFLTTKCYELAHLYCFEDAPPAVAP